MDNYLREGEMPEERMIKLVTDHLGLSISHDISDFENVDCSIYNESSADGYDLYVCTNDTRNVSICENVYYYDHDLANAFEQQVRWGDRTFYIDQDIYDDCYMEDKLIELFADNVQDIIEDDELDLTLGEINYLKQEYDLNEEEEPAKT
tara:strand:- start:520 stop:966 length:447 start_codon:yes stop_codon:yes gene_type:complete